MKAEEHSLSQKPLIERITPGKWRLSAVKRRNGKPSFIEVVSEYSKTPIVNWQGFDDSHRDSYEHYANGEAIAMIPTLLKAEQELDELKKDLTALSSLANGRSEKISELEETISRLKQELKEERNPGTDINYDLHEGRGEHNELL